MPATDLHLAVEIASWWTTAVYEQGGVTHPVYFAGQARMPSGVIAEPGTGSLLTGTAALAAAMAGTDEYRPDPMGLAHNGTDVTAVAAVLAHVATHASALAGTPVTALTVVTATGWGHRARQRLQQAANQVGLPVPGIVTAAAALSAGTATTGRFVLVATTAPDLAILDLDDGYQQVAHTDIVDPDHPDIDTALLARLADPPPTGWPVLREVRQARTVLAGQPRASLLLPQPHPAAVLERDDVSAAAAPHLARVPEAVKQALADADLDTADVTTVIVTGGDAVVPELGAALTAAGLPAPVVVDEPHAVARGALRITQPLAGATPPAGGTVATGRLPRTRITLTNLARVAVLAAASVAVLLQTITTADVGKLGGDIIGVLLPVENVGLAAALAVLTAWTAAQLVPTTWLTAAHADDDVTTGALLRRGYLGAAALGLAVAGLWGLGVGVGVGFDDPAYLKTALTCAIPLAACAAIIALVAPRIPQDGIVAWLGRANPPVTAIALAALGVYLQRAAFTNTFPADLLPAHGLAQIVGAVLLGIATALTATRQPLLRVITAVILGGGYALVSSVTTIAYLTWAYIAVLLWWAATTTLATVTAATPQARTWLKRLT
ncbi:Hsp70 family protein [Actinoplanes subglobosus]|uniref:Hsp70 family protein n=1 Tax=Actinoplanes subglobosus TaxID=1547892 RepID=A0ABV8IL10_9ACTN